MALLMAELITDKHVAHFRKMAKAYVREHTRSPEAARAALIDLGLATPSGKLKKTFGG